MSVSHLPVPFFCELNVHFPKPELGSGATIYGCSKEEFRKAIVASLLELIETVNCATMEVSPSYYDYTRVFFGSEQFNAWDIIIDEDEDEYDDERCEDNCYDCETGGHD
jgi:hypothetical protein